MAETIYGTYTGTIEKDDFYIEFTVSCSCDYYYDSGCMYMRNGDPGYPPEEDYDNLTWEIEELLISDYDDNEIDENTIDYESLISKHMDSLDIGADIDWKEPLRIW